MLIVMHTSPQVLPKLYTGLSCIVCPGDGLVACCTIVSSKSSQVRLGLRMGTAERCLLQVVGIKPASNTLLHSCFPCSESPGLAGTTAQETAVESWSTAPSRSNVLDPEAF